MLEKKKKRGKGVSKLGVGAERADREKGVKITKNGGKGIQIAMIRVLAMRSYVERVRMICTLILASSQCQKTSEL